MSSECPCLRNGLQAVPVTYQGKSCVALVDPTGFADRQVLLPMPLLYILERFDGQHTLRDIQTDVMRQFSQLVPTSDLERIVKNLDDCYLLDSPRFEGLLYEREEAYRAQPTRKASHAGQAYPTDPDELRALLDEILAAGVPEADGFPRNRPVRAVVAPHIDYRRGHDCYGHVYNVIRKHPPAERYIVFGTNHHGRNHSFVATRKPFETPLGLVETDTEFLDRMAEGFDGDLYENELDHQFEHSIELQVVFLKHILGDRPFRIVPVLCSGVDLVAALGRCPADDETLVGFLGAMQEAIAAGGVSTCVIAGVDLSHIGRHFGDERTLDDDWLAAIGEQDRASLARVAALDVPGFYDSVMDDGNDRRVCGLSPIYALLHVAGVHRMHLLHYKQCVDHEAQCAVTCAAMAGF